MNGKNDEPSGTQVALGCLTLALVLLIGCGLAIKQDLESAQSEKRQWLALAQRNPEVEIVTVRSESYNKFGDEQLIVTVRGTTSGEEFELREARHHFKFPSRPEPGDIWRMSCVDNPQHAGGFELKLERMGDRP